MSHDDWRRPKRPGYSTGVSNGESRESTSSAPVTQRQEDLLLELFVELSPEDRIKVVKLARDLVKAANQD